mgnify:CR=1 FL=1
MNAKEIKEYRKKHNLTQKQLAEITKSSLRAVQYWESQGRKVPGSAIELMNLHSYHSHNGATHNTNTQGENNYINDSNNTTQGIQEAQGQSYELKDMKTLLKQLHETKIIEIERLTALYNGIITNQNELISQYRKEIEYLRQKVKEYREKYEK